LNRNPAVITWDDGSDPKSFSGSGGEVVETGLISKN